MWGYYSHAEKKKKGKMWNWKTQQPSQSKHSLNMRRFEPWIFSLILSEIANQTIKFSVKILGFW